jgi:hypothetical protein
VRRVLLRKPDGNAKRNEIRQINQTEKPDEVLCTRNPSTGEAEAGGSQVPGQPGLPSETV